MGAPSPAAEGMSRVRLFGLTLASDFPFRSRLGSAEGVADLVFTCSDRAPFSTELGEPAYESPLRTEAGESLALLYRLNGAELLRFGDAMDFYLGSDRVHCHLRDPAAGPLVEICLLGTVLAYLLEVRGICVLHASAVVVEERAVAFMAGHQGGKSGLAAALVAAGHPLLSDDLLPIEEQAGRLLARAGYPQMRMWPEQADFFLGSSSGLALVHPEYDKRMVPVGERGFGTFRSAARPLGCLYLPERRPEGDPETGVAIHQVPPREAVIELVRGSFSPFIVEAVGLQPRRIELFSRLAERVPVRRLVYPSGFGALAEVRRALLADPGGR